MAKPLPFLLLCAAVAAAEPAQAQPPSVDQAVSAYMAKLNAPSVAIAVVSRGKVVLDRAWGMADLENFVPAKTETLFRIASVAKPITAVAVMLLVERGRIDLDAPITRYVPAYPHAVPVRDLLRHTGGVRHYKNGAEFASIRRCERLPEGMEVFAKDPLEHAAGQGITYSTYGYVLLGLAIEQASGMRFEDYVRQNILEPAGMTHTHPDDLQKIMPNRSEGYTKSDNGVRNADLVDTSCRRPGGGFLSTARDLTRFAEALRSGKLLKAETRRQMMASHISPNLMERMLADIRAKQGPDAIPPGYKPPGLGFGWAIGRDAHPQAVWHGGNQQGATSMLYLLPDREVAVAVLTNLEGQGEETAKLAEQIISIVAGPR